MPACGRLREQYEFSFKIDAFFIHIWTMGLDLILYGKYVIYERLFCWIWKCFYVLDDLFFYHQKRHVIQNLFQKLSIFKTECSSSEIWYCQWQIFQCNTSFYRLDLVPRFQIIKTPQWCGFTLLILMFFLWPPIPLWPVE